MQTKHTTYFEMLRRPLNPHGARSLTAFLTIDMNRGTSPFGNGDTHDG